MRNLKKVLSLTLALVMMLGMMTFAGAAETKKVTTAADLTDMDKVVNKEAVSLLVDLGIVGGRDTGAYDPAGTLTRGEFAKMIYVSKMGEDDKALNFVGAPTGLTDLKGKWSEGYVNYCYSTGIVSGRTATVFDPDGKVKTAEAAKMLLVLLGYDAKAEGYTANALWSVNVMQQAKQSGLLAGVKDAADAFLTRDSAAQLIANALFANTVKNTYGYDMNGKKYVNGSQANDTTLGNEVFNLMKEDISVTGINTDGTIKFSATAIGLGAKITAAKFDCSSAMLGNKLAIYYKATSFIVTNHVVAAAGTEKLYTTAPVVKMGNILGTSNDGTALAKLTNKSDDAFIAELNSPVAYFLNGESVKNTDADKDNKRGVIVELIDNDTDGLADVVKLTKKTVGLLTGDVATKAVSGKDTQVKIPGVIGSFTDVNTVKTVVGYEGLKNGDNVLYVKVGNVTTIEKAKTVDGKVTAVTSADELRIAGTTYPSSGLNNYAATAHAWSEYKNTYTFALDNSGAIVAHKAITEETASKYAVGLEFAYKPGTGGVDGAKGVVQARMLYTDGTTEVKIVTKVNGVKVEPVGTSATYYKVATDSDDTKADLVAGVNTAYTGNDTKHDTEVKVFAFDAAIANNATALGNKFYSYKADKDGNLELNSLVVAKGDTLPSDLSAANSDAAGAIVSNTANFTGGLIGNANTVFVTAKGSDPVTYATYTGIAKVPAMTAASGSVALIGKDGVASYVYLTTTAFAADASTLKYFYIVDKATYTMVVDGDNTYYEFAAIVDGNAKAIVKAEASTTFAANGLYATADTTDGIVTGSPAVIHATQGQATGIMAVGGNTLLVEKAATGDATNPMNGIKAFTYDAETVVYVIDPTGTKTTVETITGDAIAKDKNDKVVVVEVDGSKTHLAKTIFVIKQNGVSTLSALKYTIAGEAAAEIDLTGGATTFEVEIAKAHADKALTISTATATDAVTPLPVVTVIGEGKTVAGKTLKVLVTVAGEVDSTTYTINFNVKAS